jgi:hypothetical protein
MRTGELVVEATEIVQRDTAGERRERAFRGRHEQQNESELSKQNTTVVVLTYKSIC